MFLRQKQSANHKNNLFHFKEITKLIFLKGNVYVYLEKAVLYYMQTKKMFTK